MNKEQIQAEINAMETAGYGYQGLSIPEYDSKLDMLKKQLKAAEKAEKKAKKNEPVMMFDPATGETTTLDDYTKRISEEAASTNNALRYDTAVAEGNEEARQQVLRDVDKANKENGSETPQWVLDEMKPEEKASTPAKPENKLTFQDFLNAVNNGADPEEWLAQHPGYKPGDKTNAWLAEWRAKKKMEEAETSIEDSSEDSTIDSKEEAKSTIEEAKKDPSGWEKFWNAWKSGQFEMYPTMKAVADAIAKNAQMNADRANVLTGKGSDPSVYTPIETEQDKIREKQLDERADTGYSKEQAFNNAENGDFEALGRMIADGEISYENAYMGLSGTAKDKFEKWYKNAESLNDLTVEQAKVQLKKDATSAIAALSQEKTALQQLKNSLAGNDYNAFNAAVNAYKNAYGGIQSTGSAITKSMQESTNYQNAFSASTGAGANIKMVKAHLDLSDTYTNGGSSQNGSSSTGTSQVDTLLMNHLNEILKAGNDQMAMKNAANKEFINSIDERIAEIDAEIADWRKVGK